jgi:hypothetical protein
MRLMLRQTKAFGIKEEMTMANSLLQFGDRIA